MGLVIRQALLMAAKDAKLFIKDRFALGFAFLFPLLFVYGFSLAFADAAPEDRKLEFTVATQETNGISNQIITGLTSAEGSAIRQISYEAAQKELDDGDLGGYILFPADFTTKIMNGQQSTIEVVAKSDDPNTRAALNGLGQGIANQIVASYSTVVAISQITRQPPDPSMLSGGSAGGGTQLLEIRYEQVGDIEPFNASNFTLPGYLTMFVFFAAAMGAEAIAKERQTHTLERLMSNGVRRESVIFGKFLAALYIGLSQLAVFWIVGILLLRVNFGESPIAVILVSLLMAFASAGFAVMLASIVKTVRSASAAGVLCSLILAPVGGSWWPLFIVPAWMQTLARLTPHGWANTAFNKLMLFGADFGDVVVELIALVIFAFIFIAIALWKFRTAPTN